MVVTALIVACLHADPASCWAEAVPLPGMTLGQCWQQAYTFRVFAERRRRALTEFRCMEI